MARTINLIDLKITRLVIDYDRQAVAVMYSLQDADGKAWVSSEATFL